MSPSPTLFATVAVVAAFSLASPPASAVQGQRWSQGIGYYVAIDTLPVIASGTFAGLANPNAGRLTWLWDDEDHFHSIGAYSYTGTAGAAVIRTTNANNRVPELSTRTSAASSAIPFVAGSGAFAGNWASSVLPAGSPTSVYSYLGVASIQSLDGMSAGANELYASSGNRWSADFNSVAVGLRLLSATPGLKVAIGNALDAFAGSNTVALGDSSVFEALPVFHVTGDSAPGIYSAEFQLVNLGANANVRSGGTFHFDFQVSPVPEPATGLMLAAGVLTLIAAAQRRRRQQV